MDPDQAGVSLILIYMGSNCLKKLTADETSMQLVNLAAIVWNPNGVCDKR